MFGGQAYVDGLLWPSSTRGSASSRATPPHVKGFVVAGLVPFCFTGKDGERVRRASCPPEEATESPPLMLPWRRLALEAALQRTRKRQRQPGRADLLSSASTPAKKAARPARLPQGLPVSRHSPAIRPAQICIARQSACIGLRGPAPPRSATAGGKTPPCKTLAHHPCGLRGCAHHVHQRHGRHQSQGGHARHVQEPGGQRFASDPSVCRKGR